MKMKLTEFFMRRPVLFWSLVGAILIAGVLSFLAAQRQEGEERVPQRLGAADC